MTGLSKVDQIREQLIREAHGSFRVVRKALSEAAEVQKSNVMDIDDVKARIRRIVLEEQKEVA